MPAGGSPRAAGAWAVVMSVLALAASASTPVPPLSRRVLVLHSSPDTLRTHSQFLSSLRSQAQRLEVRGVEDEDWELRHYDAWHHDALVVLGSTLGPRLSPDTVLSFFDDGHALFLAMDASADGPLRQLVSALGADLDAPGSAVFDHFEHDQALGAERHDAVRGVVAPAPAVLLPSAPKGALLARGTALSLPPSASLAWVVAHAGPAAYCRPPPPRRGARAQPVRLSGAEAALVAAGQARNNARWAASASLEAASDEFFAAGGANRAFFEDLAAWTLGARGVLVAGAPRHARWDEASQRWEESPEAYRVGDDVVFEIDVMERGRDGSLAPHVSDRLQVELRMLDPYVRTTLAHRGNGTYRAEVVAPDVYGVFKWELRSDRRGWSSVREAVVVPIRPFRHDEYERFIPQAYPYYAAALVMMASFLLASGLFLYSQP